MKPPLPDFTSPSLRRLGALPSDAVLLAYEDVAALGACSTRTIERLVASGELRALWLTKRTVRVTLGDWRAFVASRSDGGNRHLQAGTNVCAPR